MFQMEGEEPGNRLPVNHRGFMLPNSAEFSGTGSTDGSVSLA
jgi:hypothetical protein